MKNLRGDFEKINTSLPSDMAKELRELSYRTALPQVVLFREAVLDLLSKHRSAATCATVVEAPVRCTRGDLSAGATAR